MKIDFVIINKVLKLKSLEKIKSFSSEAKPPNQLQNFKKIDRGFNYRKKKAIKINNEQRSLQKNMNAFMKFYRETSSEEFV